MLPEVSPPEDGRSRVSKSEKLPDPPHYTGKKEQLKPFLLELSIKLQMNNDRFANEQAKVLYSYTRMACDGVVMVSSDDIGAE